MCSNFSTKGKFYVYIKHSTKSNKICDFFVVTMLLDNIYADCTHEKHVKNEIDYLQFSQHLASVHQYMGH